MSSPLTIEDMIARYPGTTKQSWAQQRYLGTGPTFIKIGRRVYYRLEDVQAWEDSQARTQTRGDAA